MSWLLVLLVFASSAFASDPKLVYDQATDALYNLDFNIAQRGYESLTHDYPDNPDYWNALASSIWLRIMYDQQKLNMESFAGSSLGTGASHDMVDPADEKRLRDVVATAIQKADAILNNNPNDVPALYAKGISNATLASFEASAKRAYFTAGSKARVARDLHQQVLNLDPSFDDALMAVGAYNYIVGVIPTFVRLMLLPLGIRSAGKEVGIQQIEIAAAKGKTTSTDARMLLAVVYNREKRYEQGAKMLDELHAKYPRNYVFEMAKAATFGKMKRWDDAVHTYEQVLAKVQTKKDGYQRLNGAKVFYLLGTSNVERYQFEQALQDFEHVTTSKEATPDEKGNSYLWQGKIYDSKKDRAKALQQYNALLALNCSGNLKAEAARYKRRPFGE